MTIEAAAWLPEPPPPEPVQDSESLELLLTSDLIARNQHLAFWENLDAAALAGLCGLDPTAVEGVKTVGIADTVEIGQA